MTPATHLEYTRTVARKICFTEIALSSLRIALVVGTALNVINEGSHFLDGDRLQVGHITLNYAVPYCVAIFSAVTTRLKDIRAHEDKRE